VREYKPRCPPGGAFTFRIDPSPTARQAGRPNWSSIPNTCDARHDEARRGHTAKTRRQKRPAPCGSGVNRAIGGRQRPIKHGFAHRVVRPTQPECRAYQHRSKTRHQKRSDIAEFRARRPAHISETSRYRAVFERPSYVTRWRRTGWLGRQDSNLCISELGRHDSQLGAGGFDLPHDLATHKFLHSFDRVQWRAHMTRQITGSSRSSR
jgi:hypothetical protein